MTRIIAGAARGRRLAVRMGRRVSTSRSRTTSRAKIVQCQEPWNQGSRCPAWPTPEQAGGRGSVQQKALEASNVDVSLEFTQLIIAQRGFQVNARTITVSDQVLQDLVNIIR